MKHSLTSPSGITVIIDIEADTASVPKINATAKITSSAPLNDYMRKRNNLPVAAKWTLTTDHNKMQHIVLTDIDACEKMEAARQEKKDRIFDAREEAVPGLRQLQKAQMDEEIYQEQFNAMMEDEQNDGVNPPSAPKISFDELAKKYPRAAVYVRAEGYKCASHYAKSAAGEKAMKLLKQGGEIKEAEFILENWLPESAKWD